MNSASYNAGYATASLIGPILLFVLPIAAGYFIAGRMNRNRDYGTTIKWPTIVGVVVSLFFMVAYCTGQDSSADRGASTDSEAIVVNDGPAARDFPAVVFKESLEQFRTITDEELKRYASKEYDVSRWRSLASALRLGGLTVMRYEAHSTNAPSVIQFTGVVKGHIKVLTCSPPDGKESKDCTSKAHALFGQPSTEDLRVEKNG